MRPIDADALKNNISINYGSVMDAVIVNRIIDEQPTIKQAIKQGKWIKRKPWSKFVCSCCGFEHNENTKFCSNCGAKMDLKEKK